MVVYGTTTVTNSGGKKIIDGSSPSLRVFAKGTTWCAAEQDVKIIPTPAGCVAPLLFLKPTVPGWTWPFFVSPQQYQPADVRFSWMGTGNVDWAICGVQTDTDPGAEHAAVWRRPADQVVLFSSAYEYMRLYPLPTLVTNISRVPGYSASWDWSGAAVPFQQDSYICIASNYRWDMNATFAYYAGIAIESQTTIRGQRGQIRKDAGLGEVFNSPTPDFVPPYPLQYFCFHGRLTSGG